MHDTEVYFLCSRCYTKYVGIRCEMIDPEMIFGPSESKPCIEQSVDPKTLLKH